MALIVRTKNPADLLKKIQQQIETGHIKTWIIKDKYITHNAEQWKYKAWFLPKVGLDVLVFYIRPPKNGLITSIVYAVYHGRLSEMLLGHFDSSFTQAVATALPIQGDSIKSK